MLARFTRFSLAFSEIYRCWHQLATEEMAPYGLKGPHCTYLLHISQHPDGLTATQICELTGKDKADVSRAMNYLENKGMVIKEGIHQNLYRGVYKLTDDGEKVAEHVCNRASLAVSLAAGDMSYEDGVTFFAAMEQVAANLKKISETGIPKE